MLGPPPDTPIAPGAAPVVNGDTVTLDFGTPGTGYECSVDGAAFTPCTSPLRTSGLAPGPHTVDVRSVDADGRADPTPRRFAFDVPAGSVLGAEAADLDRDRIPDSQETLPLGNVPPIAGVRTLASLISGEVYVKLPRTVPQQVGALAGFVPLKGIAALPVGSIVDARRGKLAIESAGDGRAGTDPRRRLGHATLAQAIFQIRQARLRRIALRSRQIPTSFVLQSPPNAERGCRASRPAKGIVRTFTATANGFFRVSGAPAAPRAAPRRGGRPIAAPATTTRVTRGRVTRLRQGAPAHAITLQGGSRATSRAPGSSRPARGAARVERRVFRRRGSRDADPTAWARRRNPPPGPSRTRCRSPTRAVRSRTPRARR